MKTLFRALTPEVKIVDAANGLVDYIASDETLDCYSEIIRADGWRFDLFEKNAPFVNSHDYSKIENLLGKVVSFRVQGNQLVERVQYSMEPDTLALWAFKMVRDGFLKAVSVGFRPVRMASKWDGDKGEFMEQIAELGLDAAAASQLQAVYIEQQQLELSQCILGANPNALALAKAYKGGCLTEEDMVKISALDAKLKHASLTDGPAAVEGASQRARLALLAEIHTHL